MLYEAGLRNVQFDDPGMACKSIPLVAYDGARQLTTVRRLLF